MDKRIAMAVMVGLVIILIAMGLYGYLSGAWDASDLNKERSGVPEQTQGR